MISPIESWSACGARTISASGISATLRSHTLIVSWGTSVRATQTSRPLSRTRSAKNSLECLLNQIGVDDANAVSIQGEVDRQITDEG